MAVLERLDLFRGLLENVSDEVDERLFEDLEGMKKCKKTQRSKQSSIICLERKESLYGCCKS